MKNNKPYTYQIILQDREIGPFDRRTIIGMRVKKLLKNHYVAVRNDGHRMTVEELLADRFEMSDPISPNAHLAATAMASGIWPTFSVNYGGTGGQPSILGFIGKGELCFQGDVLRLVGRRKKGLFGSTKERMKLPTAGIASAKYAGRTRNVLQLQFKPDESLDPLVRGQTILLTLDTVEDVSELLDFLDLA